MHAPSVLTTGLSSIPMVLTWLFLAGLLCKPGLRTLEDPCTVHCLATAEHMARAFLARVLQNRYLSIQGGCSSVVEPPPPNQKVPGSSPGPGIVQAGYGCTTHVVVPRRSDGTLNRGLVCVAHQTWTIKIPTSLRKRICDCRRIQTAYT